MYEEGIFFSYSGDLEINRKSSVRVSIMTTPKRIIFLKELMKSLNLQTFPDFDIALIVPSGSIKYYKGLESGSSLNIIEQRGMGFMDAMQEAVDTSKGYDFNINLDDDSIISRDHIERYLKAFSKAEKVGIIFGTEAHHIIGTKGNLRRFLKYNYYMNRHPLSNLLINYPVFFNSAGLLSGKLDYGVGSNTLMGAGMNMAWVPEALDNASLPAYNFESRGILNEQYLALQAVMSGYEVRISDVDSTQRKETRGNSLSSGSGVKEYMRRLFELYSSPIFVNSILRVEPLDLRRTITKMKLMTLWPDIRVCVKVLKSVATSIETGLKADEAFLEIEKLWESQLL